jgi:hypothetical protein
MTGSRAVVFLIALCWLCSSETPAEARVIATSDVEGAWNYYFQQGGPGDFDPSYYSTSLEAVSKV